MKQSWWPVYCEACGGRVAMSPMPCIREAFCDQCMLLLEDPLFLFTSALNSNPFVAQLLAQLRVIKSIYDISQDAMIPRTECQKYLDKQPGFVVEFQDGMGEMKRSGNE